MMHQSPDWVLEQFEVATAEPSTMAVMEPAPTLFLSQEARERRLKNAMSSKRTVCFMMPSFCVYTNIKFILCNAKNFKC